MPDAPTPFAGALIRGAGDYYGPVGESLPDLKPLMVETIGGAIRRVGRFIQLGVAGAARALGGQQPPAATGVYLTSGRGDMEVTVEVMSQIYRDGSAPRPLSFINTVSNSACFYIAKQFRLHGRSTFVCNRHFSFETALSLAVLDMEMGVSTSALAGSVDIAVSPLDIHRQRLRLPADTPVAEGSHWLWLEAADASVAGPRIRSIEFLPDVEALADWMKAQAPDPSRAAVAIGQFAVDGVVRNAASAAGVTGLFEYRTGRAYYDSQSGAAVSAFLDSGFDADVLLHVNMDDRGAFAVFAVSR
jgi:hypothetical protein